MKRIRIKAEKSEPTEKETYESEYRNSGFDRGHRLAGLRVQRNGLSQFVGFKSVQWSAE